MSYIFNTGATNKSIYFYAKDSTTGAAKTGLAWNDAGASAYYARNRAAATSITLATLASSSAAHSDGGFIEVDGTNMTGVYRFDLPDAVLSSGSDNVIVKLQFTNTIIEPHLIALTPPVNAVEFSGDATAADNAELFFDGTGYNAANSTVGTVTDVTNQVTADATAISGSTVAADNVEANIGNLDAAITTRSTLSAANVNSEVSDVLKTDTVSEPSQQAPPATPTMEEMLSYLYAALRNKIDVTSSSKEFHNDAGVVIWKKALTDNGTTYSEAEGATGP